MEDYDCLEIDTIVGFEWDDGNIYKNEIKHNIKWQTIEEIFFNEPLLVFENKKHSDGECRCYALGHTDDMTNLFIAFPRRGDKIRVISARKMSKKERQFYEEVKKDPEI